MLIQYILNHLRKSNVEESVQGSVVDLLSKIKENDALLSEFNSMDSHTLTSQLTVDHNVVERPTESKPSANQDDPTIFFQDMNLEYALSMDNDGSQHIDINTLDVIHDLPIPDVR